MLSNSLAEKCPDILELWDYEKNRDICLTDMSIHSKKKVWWRCSQGHEWVVAINNRTNGNGCPYCSGRYIVKGENDLQTVNPTLAKEWNYEKNIGLTPVDILSNSNEKVWWKCEKGHEWQAITASRNKGIGCPYCSGRFAVKGENDLKTLNPTLAKEWNYEKNIGLTPTDVLPNSGKKVWWKCSNGHEWQARIADRNRGQGCPVCYKEKSKR
jgi:DNA-directed RNA polymerase subunit RPC12/RpoP